MNETEAAWAKLVKSKYPLDQYPADKNEIDRHIEMVARDLVRIQIKRGRQQLVIPDYVETKIVREICYAIRHLAYAERILEGKERVEPTEFNKGSTV